MDQDSDSPLKRFIEDLPEKEEEEKKDEIFERSSSFGLADLFHQKKGDYAIFIPPPPTSITLQSLQALPQDSVYNSIGRNDPFEVKIKKKWAFSKLREMEFQEQMIKRCLDEIPNIQRISYQEILEIAVVQLCDQVPVEEFEENQNEVDFMQIQQKITRSFSQILKGSGGIKQQVQERHHSLHEPLNLKEFSNFSSSNTRKYREQSIHKECPICLEKYVLSSLSSPILTCSHNFCPDCLKSYITSKINCADVISITCPQEKCEQVFSDETIHLILQDDYQYERYVKFKSKQKLLKDPDVRQCITPDCNQTIKGTPNNPKLICNECGQAMCYFCTNPWHEGITCEEAIDAEYNTIASKFLVKLCPQCSSRILKNDGCNHMTCTRCNYEFCWLCLKPYMSNHFSSNNIHGCPGLQYAQRIPILFWQRFYLKKACLGFLFVLLGILAVCLLPLAIGLFAVAVPLAGYIIIKDDINNYSNNCIEALKFAAILVIGVVTAPLNVIVSLLHFLILFLIK